MTDDNDEVLELADLNVDYVRSSNDHVDNRMTELEDQISELEQQVATLESEKEDLAEEKEATEELLAEFQEDQRQKQLNRIKEANDAVAPDEEVDLSTLEDASVDQLETVADMIEAAAGSAEVSNTDASPDLSNVDSNDGSDDLEEAMAEVAQEEGLYGMYKDLHTDEQANDDPSVRDLLDSYEQNNETAGGAWE